MKIQVLALSLILLLAAGCSGKNKNNDNDEANLARVEFKADTVEVELFTIQYASFRRELLSNGRLRAKVRSSLAFESSGMIDKILVSNGDWVEAGQVLATLNTFEADNSFLSAQLAFERAKIDLNDKIIGFGYQGIHDSIPEKTMELARIHSGYTVSELSLANARRAVEGCTLRAPYRGRVANVAGNEYERNATEFCTLIDDNRLIVDFAILETELDLVKKGQTVQVASFFHPDRYTRGVVTSINPTVDQNGQVLIEAEIPNNGSFIDGMNVKIILENEIPEQLVVPKSAVVLRDNLEVLFRHVNGKALWTYVHILKENSREYVVTANTSRGADLSPGDAVIVSGNMNLADGTVVKAVNVQ